MKFVVVMVEWIDAHQGTESWTHVDDLDDSERVIRSVGFLLPSDEYGKLGHVTIAQSIDEEQGMVDNVLHIPVGMVRKTVSVGSMA